MARTADVRAIDALKDAKAALVEFREIVGVALSEAHAEVQRTLWWLQHDQPLYWKAEKRRRTAQVAQAKSDLYRAQLAATDGRASCMEQKKALQKAERRLQEADQKIELVKKWARVIDREMLLYKAQCQGIGRAVDTDLPKGEARLELMIDKLDAYVRLAAPTTGTDRPAPPTPSPTPPPTPAAGDKVDER